MPNNELCNKVVTIPQFLGTCWFNAILMALLYSQNSRKLLLNNKKLLRKTDELSSIIITILKKHYIKHNKVFEYYNIIRPEKILTYLNLPQQLYNYIIKYGYYSNLFIGYFLSYLNSSYVILEHIDNNLIVGLHENLNIELDYTLNNFKYELRDELLNDVFFDNLSNKLKRESLPDYLIVNIFTRERYFDKYLQLVLNVLHTPSLSNKILLDTYVKTYNLKELSNEIIYRNEEYILDSCILANFNDIDIKLGHAIAGLTCKGDRYVYNGWTRTTVDPSKIDNNYLSNSNLLPCELMKFDWDIKNPHDQFCLNHTTCSLDKIQYPGGNLCFSFGKGDRTLIYVRKSKQLLNSININISSRSTDSLLENKKRKKLRDDYIEIKSESESESNIGRRRKIIDEIEEDEEDESDNELNDKLCKKWIKNKKINPITKKQINESSSIYKKLKSKCKKILEKKEELSDIISKEKHLTEKTCKQWRINPDKNPLTGRTIKKYNVTYKKIEKECKKIEKEQDDSLSSIVIKKIKKEKKEKKDTIDKIVCLAWKENQLINPLTGRSIKKNGPTYNNLKKHCDTFLNDDKISISNISSSSSSSSNNISALKLNKLNREYCLNWEKNKTINPITLKTIKKDSIGYNKIDEECKKLLIPINVIDVIENERERLDNFEILNNYIKKINLKHKSNCIKYKEDKNEYYIGNKILLKQKIGKASTSGVIYLSTYTDKNKNKTINYAIKIVNKKDKIANIKSEIRILEYLTKIALDNECPHFPITYDILICNRKKIEDIEQYPKDIIKILNKKGDLIFIINELAEGDLNSFINKVILVNLSQTKELFLNALAQVFLGLIFFHNKVNALHADITSGNFLYHITIPEGYYHYKLFGIDYYLKNMGYLWIIWDFGMTVPFINSDIINIDKESELTDKIFSYDNKKKKIDYLNYFGQANKYKITFDLELILNENYIFLDFPTTSYVRELKSTLTTEVLNKHRTYGSDGSKISELDKEILRWMVKYIPSFTSMKPANAKIINSSPYILY